MRSTSNLCLQHKDNETNELFMTPQDFEDIPELVKNPLGTRLIEAFFADAEYAMHNILRVS